MTKICVMGDSHLWTIRKAFSQGANLEGVDAVHFAGAAGTGLYSLQANGSFIQLPGDNYRSLHGFDETGSLDMSEFSALVIIGLGSSVRASLPLYNRWRTTKMDTEKSVTLVSLSCFATAEAGLLRQCGAMTVAACIRRATQVPIVVIPDPYPLSEITQRDEAWDIVEADQSLLRELHWAAARAALPAGGILIEQPPETMDGLLHTKTEFSANIYKEDPSKREFYHMNEGYGHLLVKELDLFLSALMGSNLDTSLAAVSQ
ncbi:hypothetical protein [Oceanicella sp. SM1341]|uniref:hypothetical protein n=1 Tax=Oceanicella sp. SM1341 TaxID=1548889 RepID=UPI0013005EEC|nr:hypothetical protein [Oceanicella sp. SM1341]